MTASELKYQGLSGSMGTDNEPYTTLSYANGPGYNSTFVNGNRVNLSDIDTSTSPYYSRHVLKKLNFSFSFSPASDSFKQPAGVPLNSETHGGDDVAIFAFGPQAHLFQGVYEQNYIAHLMGYAACIGPGLKYCDSNPIENSASLASFSPIFLILYCLLVVLRFFD